MSEPIRSVPFETVLDEEVAQIAAGRGGGNAPPREGDAYAKAQAMSLSGLAFSGGGIRSATFNLGLIQALSERKLLRRFDYLSTVSGGGYIGSWLSAQIHQRHLAAPASPPLAVLDSLESELSPTDGTAPKATESKAIGFLRQYSNYLTPRVGLLSTDSLAAIATYVRNVVLIQTTVIALLLALLAMPRVLYDVALSAKACAGWLGTALLVLAAAGIGFNLRAGGRPLLQSTRFVVYCVVVPAVAGAFLVAVDLSHEWTLVDAVRIWLLDEPREAAPHAAGIEWWAGGMAALYGALSAVIALFPSDKKEAPLPWAALCIGAGIIAGTVGGGGLYLLHQGMYVMTATASLWLAVSVAPFVILQILAVMIIVHLGLIGRLFDYQLHEWWARYGAWIIAVQVWIGGLFALAVYGPALVEYGREWMVFAGGPIWVLATLWGVLAGKSPQTDGKGPAQQQEPGEVKVSWTERLLPLAPYVFILGLVILLSYALYRGLGGEVFAVAPLSKTLEDVLDSMSGSTWQQDAGAFAVFLGIFALFAWRVDINLFSLHNFYRNRLTRAYLGAARAAVGKRHPHPFTGFDIDDDVRLADLVHDGTVQRPYHILNTALNISAGENLAWQQRKAGAFFFSPQYCGYALPPSGDPKDRACGFVQTANYMPTSSAFGPAKDNGPMLGSAVAVSGAAASPNWGFHTSTAVAFLLTLFNVRLGRWCPNTGLEKVVPYQSPTFGGGLLLQELFGSTDVRSKWVYLSDGGHFDNLGIYELVRRRAKLIVVGDCGQDIDRRFDDLADTLRKCYTDFGARIELDVGPLALLSAKGEERFSKKNVIAGKICYPACGGARAFEGRILLVKPSLSDESYRQAPDIRNYALANVDFPQQTTVDQFFDEAQFESYRRLGYLIGRDGLLNWSDEDGNTLNTLLTSS